MGIRFLFLLIAIVIIWLILRSYLQKHITSSSSKTPPKIKSEKVIACHRCGLHIPAHEAIKSGEYFYCSKEHAQQ